MQLSRKMRNLETEYLAEIRFKFFSRNFFWCYCASSFWAISEPNSDKTRRQDQYPAGRVDVAFLGPFTGIG